MIEKKRYCAWIKYQVSKFPIVHACGRKPFTIISIMHREVLLSTGVFTSLGSNQLYYSGKIYFQDKTSGEIIEVDQKGYIIFDRDKLDAITNANLKNKVLEDP